MADRPDFFPEIALQDLNNSQGSPNKTRPVDSLRQQGWDANAFPASNNFNWLFENIDAWLKHNDERLNNVGSINTPVGSVYTNLTDSRNPAVILGFGTWQSLAGRTLIGAGTYIDSRGEERTFVANTTVGTYSHQLSIAELPPHQHKVAFDSKSSSADQDTWSGDDLGRVGEDGNAGARWVNRTSAVGGNQAHNNIQPSLVAYMWVRTG